MEGFQILDDLDIRLLASLEKFEKQIPKIFSEIEDLVINFLAELKFSNKNTEDYIANLRAINRFRNELRLRMLDGGFGNQVEDFLSVLDDVFRTLNLYFGKIVNEFNPSRDFYQNLYKQMFIEARTTLVGAGVDVNVINPIIDKIRLGSLHGISKTQLIKELKETLRQENQGTRWVKQQAHDLLWQTTRNYQQAVSEDLGIKHYLYAGTQIETSRDFCKNRIGKVYTKDEIESWASLNWAGKISATTKASIFVYAGGYNCRHTFRPISKVLYNKLINKNG